MMESKRQDSIRNLLTGQEIPLLPREWKGLEKGKIHYFTCYTGKSSMAEIFNPESEKDVDKR
jgi:hypothetical protein